jgi:hypothetical protein
MPPRALHVANGDDDEDRPHGKGRDELLEVVERWADNAAKAVTRIDQVETRLTEKIAVMGQGIRLELSDIKEHLGLKPKKTTMPEPVAPHWRDEESSHHEYDPEVARFRRNVRDSVKDPQSPLDEKGAAALIRRVNDEMERDRNDRKWRALAGLPSRMLSKATESAAGVISHGLLAAIAAGTVFLWHYLSTHK